MIYVLNIEWSQKEKKKEKKREKRKEWCLGLSQILYKNITIDVYQFFLIDMIEFQPMMFVQ